MNINHFHVSGFKAVDELEVESKNTNLITVRNNSGKTSLPESINISSNPTHIAEYENNIDNLLMPIRSPHP